ncbi:MAG: CDP-diacylglycerol--glycerol-3-phosphate 3-phosphatidyltransferase [Candidatus Anoxychlamydiales bacterium]|nr:CDP-diacylglycerol--glycerol-3-phosphate 3-phosphatidyltransferase [Candidatus Anoxychlamydiales bacterium]
MLTLSNGLSVIRVPLAFLFLLNNPYIRFGAIILAMISDSIDGYFARKYKSVSKFGAFLDPAMDKFFVYFALCTLFFEHKIVLWQALAIVSRDFALIIFAAYLFITKKWATYTVKAIRWGKITTAMQFLVLIGLISNFVFSNFLYFSFIALSVLALIELFKNLLYDSVEKT